MFPYVFFECHFSNYYGYDVSEPLFSLVKSKKFQFYSIFLPFLRFLSKQTTNVRNIYHQHKVVRPPHLPNYPYLQHSQVNDPKRQKANRFSSTHTHLEDNFLRETNILDVDYNSFFRPYSLRWRHQDILILSQVRH